MNSLDRWAADGPRPAPPVPASPIPPPPTDERSWARLKARQLLGIAAHLAVSVLEPGDAADQARAFALKGRDAMLDHPRHGKNWWERHEAQLRAMVAPFLSRSAPVAAEPATTVLMPDDVLDGGALSCAVRALFPDAWEGGPIDAYYREVRRLSFPAMPTGADDPSDARERLDGGGVR